MRSSVLIQAIVGQIAPILFVGYLGLTLHHMQSYNDSVAIFSLILALGALILAFPRTEHNVKGIREVAVGALLVLQVIFSWKLSTDPRVIYAKQPELIRALKILLKFSTCAAALQFAAFLLEAFLSSRAKWVVTALAAIMASLMGSAMVLVILASPDPYIDVFANNTKAARYLLAGLNPYLQTYPDIYNGYYQYKPGFLYFPGVALWQAPFLHFFGDIRWAYVSAHAFVAASILGIAHATKKCEFTGVTVAGTWLVVPVTLFVLEQSWTDTFLAAASFAAMWAITTRSWRTAGTMLGALFAIKQHAFLYPLMGLLWIWRHEGIKALSTAAMTALITFLVMMVPFAMPHWREFYTMSIGSHVGAAMRTDAFNLTAYFFHKYQWSTSPGFQSAMSALGAVLGIGLIVIPTKAKQADYHTLPAGIFIAYGFAFAFGKWAFCNYYYLMTSLALMALLLKLPTPTAGKRIGSSLKRVLRAPLGTR